uniref:Uncharacterized protein n=1 Tax=Anguilla anguilla TaxID=7936 RepID=A0A0E9UH50_ANGAN
MLLKSRVAKFMRFLLSSYCVLKYHVLNLFSAYSNASL